MCVVQDDQHLPVRHSGPVAGGPLFGGGGDRAFRHAEIAQQPGEDIGGRRRAGRPAKGDEQLAIGEVLGHLVRDAIQRQHELFPEPLAERVPGHEPAQLRGDRAVQPQPEIGVDPGRKRLVPQFGELRHLGALKVRRWHIRQRLGVPEHERLRHRAHRAQHRKARR